MVSLALSILFRVLIYRGRFSFQPEGLSGYKSFHVVSRWNTTNQSGGRGRMNFHRVLSIECKNASVDEIKSAYTKMALQYHPDVCDISIEEESTKMFVELQEAHGDLMNQALQNDYCRGTALEGNQRAEWPLDTRESQLFELNRRSQNRMFQKNGS